MGCHVFCRCYTTGTRSGVTAIRCVMTFTIQNFMPACHKGADSRTKENIHSRNRVRRQYKESEDIIWRPYELYLNRGSLYYLVCNQ